jgi:hypothetical protein
VHNPLLCIGYCEPDTPQSDHHILSHLPVRISISASHYVADASLRACSFVLVFIEIPLLLRICPTSSKFDTLVRRVTTNYIRAGVYLAMAIVQWLSIIIAATSLIAAAVVLTLAAAFYALAGIKGQGFVGSKTLGGQGVAQMII